MLLCYYLFYATDINSQQSVKHHDNFFVMGIKYSYYLTTSCIPQIKSYRKTISVMYLSAFIHNICHSFLIKGIFDSEPLTNRYQFVV